MPSKNKDLHGLAPDHSKTVLVIIDVLNELKFPEGNDLLSHALPAAKNIAKFKAYLKRQKVPVVYANDNFGKWRSNQESLVKECLKKKCLGRSIAKLLLPEKDDYFVLKPKHSAFYATPLDTLLLYFGAKQLILTGIAGNLCVYHTALDAHIRDYNVIVPSDCVASNTESQNKGAIHELSSALHMDVRPSSYFIDQKRKF